MIYDIKITKPAEEDLDEIIKYILSDLCAPKAASDLLNKIDACYDNLEKTPFMYQLCNNSLFSLKGYRKAVINNYIFGL